MSIRCGRNSSTRWFIDQMIHRPDVSPTGCFTDQMFHRPDVSPTGCFSDQMFHRPDVSPTGCFTNRIFHQLDVLPIRCFANQMFCLSDVLLPILTLWHFMGTRIEAFIGWSEGMTFHRPSMLALQSPYDISPILCDMWKHARLKCLKCHMPCLNEA